MGSLKVYCPCLPDVSLFGLSLSPYSVDPSPQSRIGFAEKLVPVSEERRGIGPFRLLPSYLDLKPLRNLWCSHELLKWLRVRFCLREPVGWHGYAPSQSIGSPIRDVLPLFRNFPKLGK